MTVLRNYTNQSDRPAATKLLQAVRTAVMVRFWNGMITLVNSSVPRAHMQSSSVPVNTRYKKKSTCVCIIKEKKENNVLKVIAKTLRSLLFFNHVKRHRTAAAHLPDKLQSTREVWNRSHVLHDFSLVA
jgi:hypothetical protein